MENFHPVKVSRVRRVRRRYRQRGGSIKGTSGSGRYTQATDLSQGKNALPAIVRQCRRRPSSSNPAIASAVRFAAVKRNIKNSYLTRSFAGG